MRALERRDKIVDILCEKRHVKIEYLANEFGVSERTIRNDVLELSLSYPIYTKTGTWGGVYIAKGFYRNKDYLSEMQETALASALDKVDEKTRIAIQSVIDKFARPKVIR